MNNQDFFLLPLAFGLGALGAYLIAFHGVKLGLVDLPNQRSSHQIPTPKGGGIGILLAFLAACWWLQVSPFIWAGALVVSLVSLFGDRMHLAPKFRLLVQFSTGGLALAALWESPLVQIWPGLPWVGLVVLGLGLVFLVGTANFYNFMDGINGIAGITGVVAFAGLAWCNAAQGGKEQWSLLAWAVAWACFGFLPFNLPKAKVFMGDVASILLGFVFVLLLVAMAKDLWQAIALACWLLPFYGDELFTMKERIAEKASLTKAHRRHVYQLLANEGQIPHWQVSSLYGLLQALCGSLAWAAWSLEPRLSPLAAMLLFGLFGWFNHRVKARFLPLHLAAKT